MAFVQIHLHSKVLGMDEDVWAFIPDSASFDRPEKKFKTFWFLHGGSGDQTAGAISMNMDRMAKKYDMAVIMPTVHYSCFVDMHMGQKFRTYLGEELPVIMRAMFPFLSDKREDNIISGFSNGGYGTFHVGLAYPEVFGYLGAFAAGDKADADWTGRENSRIYPFGPGDLQNSDYSFKHQARMLLKNGSVLPKIYHVCGENDPWLDMNHKARDCFEGFEGNPFEYKYFQVPGRGHDSLCWQIALDKFTEEYLKLEEAPGKIF